MKVGIYARVSTKDKNQDTESQFVQMREYCQRKDWSWLEYQDKESGKLEAEETRRDLDRMINDLRSGVIDGVVITDQRRFARSVELGMRLVRNIREAKKFIDFAQDGLHIEAATYTVSDMQRLVLGFMMGEGDNMQHAKDVKRGIDAKKKRYAEQGKAWKWGRKSKIADPAKVRELRDKGWSIREIATELGVSTYPILRALKGDRA